MPSIGVGTTATQHSATTLLPSVEVAVTMASPTELAVTLPLISTDATALSDDAHAMVLFVAFSGVTVAANVTVSVAFRETASGFNTIELTGVEKARVFDPFGHAGLTPLGKIRLTP